MNISLIDLHSVRFSPSRDTDRLNDEFRNRLGVQDRYQPARLAISCSLAIPSSPPSVKKKISRTITGDTLFGYNEYFSVWIALIVEHSVEYGSDANIDKSKISELVTAHWCRGIKLMDDEWKKAEQDIYKFINRLIDVAKIPRNLPPTDTMQPTSVQGGCVSSSGKIKVPIGEISEDVASAEKIEWSLNISGGSPHSAIMGGVGSGKTRTAFAMLRSIHDQSPSVPLIAFDFKGDLGSNGNSAYNINELFGACTISPPHGPIPLNVLNLHSTGKIDISNAAYRFRDAFSNLQGSRLGSRQRDAVYTAAERALKAKSPCQLQDVLDALTEVYEEKEMKEDGAVSTMRELCRFPLFNPELHPELFFQQSWLINLPQNVPGDSRKIVVNLILNALDQYLNSLDDTKVDVDGARDLRVLCMVDEAHQILRGKLPSLSNLIRMSRSKGGAIMLISQSPDDFSGEDDEFLNEMGLIAAFSTNASSRNVKRIFGKGANLGALKNFQCLIKQRGEQASRKIQAW